MIDMLLCDIARELFESGHVRVPLIVDAAGGLSTEIKAYVPNKSELSSLDSLLNAHFEKQRLDWLDANVTCDVSAARISFMWLARTITAVANRELSEPMLGSWVQGPNSLPCVLNSDSEQVLDHRDPNVHLSVDLSFRYLKSVVDLCTAVASLDPLRVYLFEMMYRWPLSSAGVLSFGQAPLASEAKQAPLASEAKQAPPASEARQAPLASEAKQAPLALEAKQASILKAPSSQPFSDALTRIRLESLEAILSTPSTRQLLVDRIYIAAEPVHGENAGHGNHQYYLGQLSGSKEDEQLSQRVKVAFETLLSQSRDMHDPIYPKINPVTTLLPDPLEITETMTTEQIEGVS